MKNFLIYECLLPSILCLALMSPFIAVHACVSVKGDKYTVDGYGTMTPTKDELDTGISNRGSRNCKEKVQFQNSMTPMHREFPGQMKAQY